MSMAPCSPALSAWRFVVSLPRRVLVAIVHGYRLLLKPWIGNSCRFEPTCSAYALDALNRHGAVNGSLLSGARLMRCHPWCDGGIDPVPHHPPLRADGLFSRLGLRADGEPSETRKFP